MTEQELSAIYYLDKQIARLKRRIAELRGDSSIGGGIAGGSRSSQPGNPTERIALKKIELLEQLNKALEEKIEAEIAIRAFIESIDDQEVKEITELRCIEQMSWTEIAADMSTGKRDVDRTTVAKKFRNYLKKVL